jgi:asparagine synthase (glutamine-hydrolysing)
LALSLPLNQKVNHGKTKVALKRALKDILPPEVLTRKKRGFQVPLASWFRGPLRNFWKDRCLDSKGVLASYVDLREAERYLNENEHGVDHGNRLWMLLSLSTWLERMKPS